MDTHIEQKVNNVTGKCKCTFCKQKALVNLARDRKLTYTQLYDVLQYFVNLLWYRQEDEDYNRHAKPEQPTKNPLKYDAAYAGLRAKFTWQEDNYGYVYTFINGNKVYMHTMIWLAAGNKLPDGYTIDHINRHRKDNRLKNLRLATHRQQSLNQRAMDTRYDYRGVIWEQARNKYKSVGTLEGGTRVHFGYYDTQLEAAIAFDLGRLYHYTPDDLKFVTLNFPSLKRTYQTVIENPDGNFKIKEGVEMVQALSTHRLDNLKKLGSISPELVKQFA